MTHKNPPATPALASVQAELRRYLLALALVLNDIYGEHAAPAVLGGRRSGDRRKATNISHIQLYTQLPTLWEYAFNGHLSSEAASLAFARPSCFALLDALLRMLEDNSQLPALWASIEPSGEQFTPGGLRQLVEMGLARVALDTGGDLDVAMLAQLSGQSRRWVELQLAGQEGPNLQAGPRGRCIPAAIARRWLADCRHFVPTTQVVSTTEELPVALRSQRELRRFLRARIALQYDGNFADFFRKVEMPDEEIESKIDGQDDIQLCDALPLARALKLESRWLLTQILRINHPHEAGLLLPR